MEQKSETDKAIFVCYEKCTTCQKARRFLDENGVAYIVRPIKEQNPSADELRDWQEKSGLPPKRFFNTSGQLYRAMDIKNKLPGMTEEEQFSLLASDGMLVKRPILLIGGRVLVGFKEEEWQNAVNK